MNQSRRTFLKFLGGATAVAVAAPIAAFSIPLPIPSNPVTNRVGVSAYISYVGFCIQGGRTMKEWELTFEAHDGKGQKHTATERYWTPEDRKLGWQMDTDGKLYSSGLQVKDNLMADALSYSLGSRQQGKSLTATEIRERVKAWEKELGKMAVDYRQKAQDALNKWYSKMMDECLITGRAEGKFQHPLFKGKAGRYDGFVGQPISGKPIRGDEPITGNEAKLQGLEFDGMWLNEAKEIDAKTYRSFDDIPLTYGDLLMDRLWEAAPDWCKEVPKPTVMIKAQDGGIVTSVDQKEISSYINGEFPPIERRKEVRSQFYKKLRIDSTPNNRASVHYHNFMEQMQHGSFPPKEPQIQWHMGAGLEVKRNDSWLLNMVDTA